MPKEVNKFAIIIGFAFAFVFIYLMSAYEYSIKSFITMLLGFGLILFVMAYYEYLWKVIQELTRMICDDIKENILLNNESKFKNIDVESKHYIELVKNENVRIGNQIWMSENLNVGKFRNGDPIPEARTDEEWERAGKAGKSAWCYYGNDPVIGQRFGKLYNWYAVADPRGLAPKGWHIPSDEEWTRLSDYLGGEEIAGDKMKDTTGWNVTNESGFSGLPGGARSSAGYYYAIGVSGCWWSSTEGNTFDAWSLILSRSNGSVFRSYDDKRYGLSVRCLRDD